MMLLTFTKKTVLLSSSIFTLTVAFSTLANAQIIGSPADNQRELDLAADSPFHDPDVIYLEADGLIRSGNNSVLTAVGQVEGRYQDRTLRADRVVYNLDNGRIIATGNVTLIDSSGTAQFSDKLEISGELEAGTATDFTSRLANGGTTGAKLATRRTDGGIDLYNAYYTACEPCQHSEGDAKPPTWQLKARRVSQNKDRNMIQYSDARFELFGIPIFYTPYLSHPDPTVDRASGWLTPGFGISSNKGVNAELPYYVALDDYSELTLKPKLFTKVNPVLGAEYRRKFFSGEVNIDTSLTYSSIFDRNGDAFLETDEIVVPGLSSGANPETPLSGKRWRSHFFGDGSFRLSDDWDWGFSGRAVSDDLYLTRYDLDEPEKFGLIDGDRRRLVSQIFALGQDDDFRVSTAVYGFQSLQTTIREDEETPRRFIVTREDDSTLPVAAPKIELNKFYTDPIIGGRLQAFGDLAILTRKLGTDYTRGTAGLDWSKTLIGPLGIEAKPFGEIRYDYFEFETESELSSDFDRTIGQAGVDIRWPFVKSAENVDIVLEPRVQVTQNFGNGQNSNFVASDGTVLLQDSDGIDLDDSLFWSDNKSTGYDFWQEGFRADVGGSVSALWEESSATLFVGQSFASGFDDDFSSTSGLSGDTSDVVGAFDLNLNGDFSLDSRVRFDPNTDKFTRIDTGFSYSNKYFDTRWRYYKLDDSLVGLIDDPLVPNEEVSGSVTVNVFENWKVKYKATRDIDQSVNRTQEIGLIYHDDCTLVELVYQNRDFNNDAIRDSNGLKIRFSLLTLGEFGTE